jgi:pimeloyl-ACP methyl ester carboxylesterase
MMSSKLNIVSGGPADRGVVILIHAVGLDLTYWDRQIEALTAHHHVVALDLPGHGRSARAQHSGSIADLAHEWRERSTISVIGRRTSWAIPLAV